MNRNDTLRVILKNIEMIQAYNLTISEPIGMPTQKGYVGGV